jgi:trimethylamine:corrinoid methyltransferase-like protein
MEGSITMRGAIGEGRRENHDRQPPRATPSIYDENASVFRVLSDGQRQRVHDEAVGSLADPGIQVTTAAGRGVLASAGCHADGDIVRVTNCGRNGATNPRP